MVEWRERGTFRTSMQDFASLTHPSSSGAPHPACTNFRACFDDIAADASDVVTIARVEAHVHRCPPCAFALTAAKSYRRAMHRVGTACRASDQLRERVLESLREVRASRPS